MNCSLSIYMHCFSFTSLRPSHFSSKSMTCTDGLLSLLPAIGRFLFSNTCIRIYSLLLPPLCPSASPPTVPSVLSSCLSRSVTSFRLPLPFSFSYLLSKVPPALELDSFPLIHPSTRTSFSPPLPPVPKRTPLLLHPPGVRLGHLGRIGLDLERVDGLGGIDKNKSVIAVLHH